MDIDSTQQAPSIGQAYLQQVQNGDPTQAPQIPQDNGPAPALQPAPQSVQPSAAAPAQAPAPDPTTQKHTAIGRMFSSMLSGGSGSSASNFWRSLVSGAIVGMGAAEDSPVVAHGPYGDVRDRSIGGAASRGFQAGMGLQEQ